MSLWSIGSLHTRRLLSPGSGISRAQAKKRDFAYGGVAVATLAGLVGIVCFMKGADESADEVTKEVTGEEAKKQLAGEEARKQGAITEAETKEYNDDDFSLEDYLAEMTKIAAAQKARYERSCKKAAVKEVTNNSESIKDEAATKDEAAMKARFEECIKEHDKRYRSKEEKARRYELFKALANMVDRATAQGGAIFVTNCTADWTEEECQFLYDSDVDWDDYIDHIRSLIDKQNARAMKASRD